MAAIVLTAGRQKADNGLYRISLYENYARSVSEAGGVPLLAVDGNAAGWYAEAADGLLLTGGGDVAPEVFGGGLRFPSVEVDEWRDTLEFLLLREFLNLKKPVFGICRGIQLLNVAFGGTLWQDLSAQHRGLDHTKGIHRVTTKAGSLLSLLYGVRFEVNSFHHQAVRELGEGLVATAIAEDGVVEAVEHRSLPVWAVEWHPERMAGPLRETPEGPDMAPLFADFVERCEASRRGRDGI